MVIKENSDREVKLPKETKIQKPIRPRGYHITEGFDPKKIK